ncbi:hypothetical protein, partial [Bacterioplanes sanyensis]|uniref:hypothetical protein n=1 Tax=Bacterioplanes sanyensis TaxID=1249553 RepID=UPI001674330E
MKVLFMLLSMFIASYVCSFELNSGVGEKDIPQEIKSIMWHAKGGPWIPEALVMKDDDTFYWLFRNRSMALFDLAKRENLKGWGLEPWPHLDFPPEIRFTPGISGYDL